MQLAAWLQQIDVRTVMVVTATTTLLLALCLFAGLRRHFLRIGSSARLWVAATAVQPLGWVLFAQRGEWPELLSSVLANALMLGSYATYSRALRRFTGRRGSPWLPYGLVALGVVVIALFTYVWPSVEGRIVGVSPVYAAICTLATLAVLRGAPRPLAPSDAIVGLTFGAGALLFLGRTLYEALFGVPLGSLLATTPMQTLTFGYAALMPVLASFGFVLMCNDRSQADLERLAATDPLTGVLNRRMLEELVAGQLADARRHLRPLSVLLIDADHFKAINDEFGHEAGDRALRALVGAVRPLLRPTDLMGRLGGEEFVVVLGATVEAEALRVAERLRAAVADLCLLANGRRIALSVSIGVATQAAQEPDDFGALLRRADAAMYAAKGAGRNCVRAGSAPGAAAALGIMRG